MGGVDALTNIDFTFKMLNQNIKVTVLAGWFNWLEYRPGQPKDVGLIPGQGSVPIQGADRRPRIDVSLPLSLPSCLSKINYILA